MLETYVQDKDIVYKIINLVADKACLHTGYSYSWINVDSVKKLKVLEDAIGESLILNQVHNHLSKRARHLSGELEFVQEKLCDIDNLLDFGGKYDIEKLL